MSRPRLHSKSGCIACRRRRKKCDEARPVCQNCQRLKPKSSMFLVDGGVTCTWPMPDHNTVATTCEIELRHMNEFPAFTDSYQEHYVRRSFTVFQQFIDPTAAPEYHDQTLLASLVLQHSWIRDALAVFGSTVFTHVVDRSIGDEICAMTIYGRAINSLKARIDLGKFSVYTSLSLMVAMSALGLAELFGSGETVVAVHHFLAVVQICGHGQRLMHMIDDRAARALCRILTEHWLCNLASICLFCDASNICDKVDDLVNMRIVETVFQVGEVVTLQHLESPFLGGNYEIYRLMIETSCAARRTVHDDLETLARSWNERLICVEDRLRSCYTKADAQTAKVLSIKCQLHILALRIFIQKIVDPAVCSAHPRISSLIQKARTVLILRSTGMRPDPSLTWPLVIFLHAAQDTDTKDFFYEAISYIKDNYDRGHRVRLRLVLRTFQRCWTYAMCTHFMRCDHQHDAFNLLLSRRGLSGN